MTGGLMMTNEHCFDWCARQYIQVNHAEITWMLVAAGMLLLFTIIQQVWPHLQNKPVSDENMELFMNFLVYAAMMSIVAYLVYYAWFYTPKTVSDIVNNMSMLPSYGVR